MVDYLLIAVLTVQAAVYGGPLLAGGLFWLHGWKSGSDGLSRAGDVTVLCGLCIDAALLTANWLFGWVDWVATMIA
jgi:hypothetical protein